MKGAPSGKKGFLRPVDLDVLEAITNSVEEAGKAMDHKWGLGRLPIIVPIEWAERFANARRKFSDALWAYDVDAARKFGEALVRGFDKLDEVASGLRMEPGKPDQWEFMVGDKLVILVQDRARMAQADTQGRRADVWSLDEVRAILEAHQGLMAVKDAFPGAVVEEVSPARKVRQALNDNLDGIPFA